MPAKKKTDSISQGSAYPVFIAGEFWRGYSAVVTLIADHQNSDSKGGALATD